MKFVKDCIETCWRILTKPTPEILFQESQKGKDRFSQITWWLVFFGVFLSIITGLYTKSAQILVSALISFSIILPITVILSTSILFWIYRKWFHRETYIYDEILYITTGILFTIATPAFAISTLIPEQFITLYNFAILTYLIALITSSFKRLSGLSYSRSIASVIVTGMAGLAILFCIGPFILSMSGGVSRTLSR